MLRLRASVISVSCSSSPPRSCHLIGIALARKRTCRKTHFFRAYIDCLPYHICRIGKLCDKTCRFAAMYNNPSFRVCHARSYRRCNIREPRKCLLLRTRLLRPTAKSGALLPDRLMGREWQVSAGAPIHTLGGQRLGLVANCQNRTVSSWATKIMV
jgi:hypothetical protein